MVQLDLQSIAYEAKTLNLAKEGYTAFYVDGTLGLDIHDGGSWGQAFKTIQHAIDEGGSWCKIFIKAGTYAENVVIAAQGIHLIGEKKDTVIIKPPSGKGISSIGDNTSTEMLTTVGNGIGVLNAALCAVGEYSETKDVVVGNQNAGGMGLVCGGHYGICDGVSIDQGNKPNDGVWFESRHGKIKNCLIENVGRDGITLAGLDCYWNNVYDNTVSNTGRYGVHLNGLGCNYNTIFHNNIINSATANARDTTGADNTFFENFYDDHTTDANNDGMCDSVYLFTNGADYQPVSRRNGWNQVSLNPDATPSETEYRKATKSITLGTGAVPLSETLFTVTGEVECCVIGYVDVSVAGVSTAVSLGTSSNIYGLIGGTGKVHLVAGNIWVDTTGSTVRPAPSMSVIGNGADIAHTILSSSATAGAITYYCIWRPLSADGNVVAV